MGRVDECSHLHQRRNLQIELRKLDVRIWLPKLGYSSVLILHTLIWFGLASKLDLQGDIHLLLSPKSRCDSAAFPHNLPLLMHLRILELQEEGSSSSRGYPAAVILLVSRQELHTIEPTHLIRNIY